MSGSRPFKILHFTTLTGNIADFLCVVSLQEMFNAIFPGCEWTYVEMREYCGWKERRYDDAFVDMVNSHDLFLAGNGALMHLWNDVNHVASGLDIPLEIYERIHTPFIIYAGGVDVARGCHEPRAKYWRQVLDYFLAKPKNLFSVRNDGTHAAIHQYLGSKYSDSIPIVPDAGFFLKSEQQFPHPELLAGSKTVGLVVTQDLYTLPIAPNNISYDDLARGIAKGLEKAFDAEETLRTVFIPHNFKDLGLIHNIFIHMNDRKARSRATVAPYVIQEEGTRTIFDLYRNLELVVSMRVHGNVIPIGMNVPTIGLPVYPKTSGMYEELGLTDRMVVPVSPREIEDGLASLITATIHNRNGVRERYAELLSGLKKQRDHFIDEIKHSFL